MMEAIRILYAGAPQCDAMMCVVTGVNTRLGRNVQFFDEAGPALAGTRSPPPSAAAGGFSLWRNNSFLSRWNSQGTDVGDRTEERICLYPSKFGSYAGVLMATWHEMSQIFTTLNHSAFNPALGQYNPPQDPVNVAWVAYITALKACAPDVGSDPATKTNTNGTSCVCNCGTITVQARNEG